MTPTKLAGILIKIKQLPILLITGDNGRTIVSFRLCMAQTGKLTSPSIPSLPLELEIPLLHYYAR